MGMVAADGEPCEAFRSLGEARADSDASVVIEGDHGGTIYLTVLVKHVRCAQAGLEQLADDIDAMCWNDDDGLGLFFEHLPVGSGVMGGMGGGLVVDGVLHRRVAALDIRPEVEAVLAGRSDRIASRGKRWT